MKQDKFYSTLKISDFKKYNIFDSNFYSQLPAKCICGEDLLITKTLSKIYCANEFCIYNLAYRLKDLLSDIGVISTLNECINFFEVNRTRNIYFIFSHFRINNFYLENNPILEDSFINTINSNKKLHLVDLIKLGHVRELEGLESKLFCDYSSLDDFYSDLYNKKIYLLYKLLEVDINNTYLINTYKSLLIYKRDFFESLQYITLLK
ncbi:hypothetical protein [Clostridioides sp. ZZV15-6597]|uniref:hypothetical protein n=1 Tax=Clostridioides sp. ZZV15-6597 TaxID=2811500 RepID=UPI001D12FCD9|nr:hypothetical protein [Clostridioides sp. ZZV15-6597]